MVERLQQRFHDFGPFRVDASRRLLLREGNPVPLTPKAFEILMALLRNADRVVDKDELMRQVWPGTVVEENNLTRNISSLRKALEEGPTDRRYIVTIPGRGYQFATQTPNLAPESQILFERHARTQVEVEEETHDAAALPKPGLKAMALSHIGLFIGVSALVLAGLAFATFYLSKRRVAPAPTKAAESIAVLPFDTASLDPDLEYLADGIIESTIDHLSRSSDLKVISFGSVLPYRSRLVSPQEIGRALGVRRIMIGKIVIQHERIIVLAELINTADGTHIWGEQYNRKLEDIISVQEDIASEIAAKLQIGGIEEQQKRFRKRYTDDFEAYKLYVRGRYYWNKRDVPDLQRGLSYFQQAIDRDPTYALAYAGLADAYFVECAAGAIPARDGFPKAKGAALIALELDDSLAEAHASLAHIYFDYDWNWAEAEAEYRKAIALNPNYSIAHYFYGTFLFAMARNKEAFIELHRAQELDPLSPMIATFVGKGYYYSRNNHEAIAQFRNVIDSNPGFPVAPNFLVETLERAGLFEEALAQIDAMVPGAKQDPNASALHRAYQTGGAQGYLRERIRQIRLNPHGEDGGLSGGSAALYSVAGDKDQAFNMLERAYDRHELWLVYLKVDPAWDNLRADPRFQNLLRRLGLA
jgi:TolB-like protein/DNA-binding winged helix-turn-helix (wHTH) protein/Flp pilus assembly protein TadD